MFKAIINLINIIRNQSFPEQLFTFPANLSEHRLSFKLIGFKLTIMRTFAL